MLIGVVGRSGAGKSSFANKMQELDSDVIHVDVDKIGHDILKNREVIEHIISIVDDSGVVENGVVNRKKLGQIIFNDKVKYDEYYTYSQKIEYEIIDKIISNNKDKKIILDWAFLDKTKYWNKLNYKILIKTDYEIRKQRIVDRDNVDDKYFDLRENKRAEYNEDEMDYVLDGNNISEERIRKILGEL